MSEGQNVSFALADPVTSTFDPLLLNSTSVQISPSTIYVILCTKFAIDGCIMDGYLMFLGISNHGMHVGHIDLISHPIDLQGQGYSQGHCKP